MKKIRILLITLVVVLISTMMLTSNAVYATERNLTYQKTRPYSDDDKDENKDNEEYTFRKGTTDNADLLYSIVKIFDYDKKDLEVPYKKFEDSFYCLRAGKGFGNVVYGDNSSTNSTKYTTIEDVKTNANDVIAKFKELYNVDLNRTETINFNGKEYKNVNIYNSILWIADNAYLPVSTEKYNAEEYKAELLTKIGIAKVNQSMITDDDLEVIQQLAFWYFANYDEKLVSTETPVNMLAINDNNDIFGTTRANYLNRIYQYFIEGALKEGANSGSSIRDTQNSESVTIGFDKNTKFSVQDKSSTGAVINPYENYYLIGPFKVTTSDPRYNNFELILKDGKGEEINQYFYIEQTEDSLKRIQLFDIIDSTGKAVEKIEYNQEYSIRLYKASLEFIEIDTSKFSLKVSKTGKWPTANFLYATEEDQAVLEIKRDKAVAEDEITTETPKTFDLALRKYITAIRRGESNIEIADRTPQIDLTTLINGIKDERTGEIEYTATYKHKKDPVEVETGDIVTYRFTVYNEGELDGYVYSITDYLPKGLELDAESNPEFIEAKASGEYTLEELEGKKYIYSINKEKNTITISKLADNNMETGLEPFLFVLDSFDGQTLDSASIDVNFKVTGAKTGNDQVLTNVATMDYASSPRPQEETVKDRDSKPETFTEPTAEELLEQLPGYKGNEENKNDLTDSTYHYKGQEDDDDFEKIIIKGTPFDLSLRKFITLLNGTELDVDRTPKIDTSKLNTIDTATGNKITTAQYVHPKDAVTVRKGDIVTYKIRIYNEGERDGYATEIADYLPEGLGFLPEYTNNSIWSIPKTMDETTGTEVLPDGVEIKSLVGENGFYKDESQIDKDKIKLEDFKDPITGEVPTDYSSIQIVTGDKIKISTKALKDKLIKAYKSEKAEEDLWQESTNDKNDGLFYQEVEITCIVLKENTYTGVLKNVAEITGAKDAEGTEIINKGDDRDSEPDNVYEDDKHTPGNEENGYTPGEQDDDDFEQLQLKYFDLALRKFITKVDNEAPETSREPVPDVSTLIDGTYDRDGEKEHTATYSHPKEPLWVKNGSEVEYTIRVYNEGSEDGYAYEICDDIPEGLIFDSENATNKAYCWVMYRKMTEEDTDIAKEDIIEYNEEKYVVTTKAEEATMIRTRYLENTLIKAFDPETKVLSYADVKVVFTVKEPEDFDEDRVIINQAQITEDSGDDEDSTPNKWQNEDDEDIEKIRIPVFDLSLLKWVTQSVVTVDGKTTTTNTGFEPNQGLTESTGEGIRDNKEAEPIAKVELDKKKLKKTVVKFVYKIRVTNEGEIPGYATEVTDYIPEGLEFYVEDGNNKEYGWVKSGDDRIVTRALETVLLNPGESKELEITFRWINDEKNLGQKINIAEISEDANDYNTKDIDSVPNNKKDPYEKEQEDDDDFALVILSLETGTTEFFGYFTIVTISLAILGIGIYLIKKYVLIS